MSAFSTTSDTAPQGHVKAQIHDQFKVFITEAGLPFDEARNRLNDQVTAWSKDGKVSPKSVGIEYLEAQKRFVLSIGYQAETGYPVKLSAVQIGKPELTPDAVEAALNKAAAGVDNVLCHELSVDNTGEFVLVLLTHG